ncbi:hypothetical protein GWK47_036235 [Chionoecetes opilio]|uniref:Uncharacterized protein n=1 Tax=Chionoecetes opilio TaxID=41210 RepID=A0A8J4YNY3_CHIOP|nr:hypothetical protein GWK47_036235 [Chionoecetes opilio]
MPWDSLLLPRPFFTWAPMPPSMLVRRLTGGLCHGRLEDGFWGPVPDLEVRPLRVEGGQESFLYRRIPFSRLNAPSKKPWGFFGGRFGSLASFWLSLFWGQGWLPVRGENQDARWLSLGGQARVALDEGRPGPCRVWRAGTTSVNRGPSPSWAPIPVLPASGGFPHV